MKGKKLPNTQIVSDNVEEQIRELKQQAGNYIVIFGSPSASHALMQYNLIDEYWLFVNPILLGSGTPLFKNIADRVDLKLVEEAVFASGVVALHYTISK
jgi:dihydrofolate reductase